MPEHTSPLARKSLQHPTWWYAAWWSAIIEPGDAHAAALRHGLGDDDAYRWVMADQPGPLPDDIAGDQLRRASWHQAWERWRPRALQAAPDEDLGVLEGLGGYLLTPDMPEWPAGLKRLGAEEPVALWVLGRSPSNSQPSVAIVGARASTHYGTRIASDLACDLGQEGITVVSGGAYGIDIAAHCGALAGQAPTVAIMAGGVAELYPKAHEQIFGRILAAGGGIISESPPNWRPAKWRFLARNRIIAAFSDATIVVEAGRRSGALATARRAMELGLPVGAIPGPVGVEMAAGSNDLIRNGATLIRHAQDVRELIGPLAPTLSEDLFGAPIAKDEGVSALPPTQRRVWEALPKRSAAPLERLTRASGLSEREVLAALAGLELTGWVSSSASGWSRATGH
ncbi:DNA-processing protein DprA [Schaalia sp. Marseille-Q2122]|uniref:DNA-processing protein DprA n=1 Tax=Schaalia sp. Marseille-Q2122 TaxID=2736604 RepID=UPI00158A11A7|nr:DNA-processing protein DprA [Schaalia sp. Marseille-Q2122]